MALLLPCSLGLLLGLQESYRTEKSCAALLFFEFFIWKCLVMVWSSASLQSARLGQQYYLFCYGLNPKLSPKCLKKSTWNNIPRVIGNIDGTLSPVVRPGVK